MTVSHIPLSVENICQSVSRRRALGIIGVTGAMVLGLAAASSAHAAWLPPKAYTLHHVQGARTLAFHNLHTGERLRATWWRDGRVNRGALERINRILRDHRAGVVYPIHTSVLETLNQLQSRLGNSDGGTAFEIISGYRAPQTNARLRTISTGVAQRSYHTRGMAIDMRLPGVDLSTLHRTALALKRGGVGYYPTSGFVHVDAGSVRHW